MINVIKILLERVDEYSSTLFLKHHFEIIDKQIQSLKMV